MTKDLDPFKLSSPRIFLVRMTVFLILGILIAVILYRQIWAAFLANPGLNALIICVLLIGIILSYRQVFRLFPEVAWVNGFRLADPGLVSAKPPVLLAPMALAEPRRAWRFALVATIASVLGGMLGYAIGAALYDTVGQWLVNLYGYGAKMEALKQTYAEWGWLVILIKGLTPIPYKLVTITSCLLGYNFPLFVALSALTRGARFFAEAFLLNRYGPQARAIIEKRLGFWFSLSMLVLVGGIVAALYLL